MSCDKMFHIVRPGNSVFAKHSFKLDGTGDHLGDLLELSRAVLLFGQRDEKRSLPLIEGEPVSFQRRINIGCIGLAYDQETAEPFPVVGKEFANKVHGDRMREYQ